MSAPVMLFSGKQNFGKRNKLVFEKSSFKNKLSRHEKIISDAYFVHELQTILPSIGNIPTQITDLGDLKDYWLIQNVQLHHLITQEFIEAFVKKGSVHMISHGTHIDEDNCVVIQPDGKLLLHLDKDSYELLGLEGSASQFSQKRSRKYVVKIDLTQTYFKPGKKNYERVKWCLSEKLPLQMDFLCSWLPADDAVSSISIASYFRSLGLETITCPTKCSTSTMKNIHCPLVNSTQPQESQDAVCYTDFWEWLGSVALEIDSSQAGPGEFVSEFTCPEPSTNISKLTQCRVSGLILPTTVHETLSIVREQVKQNSVPWAAVITHGFQDSPITLNNWEHGYHMNGDNTLCYVIFPNDDYWYFMALSHNDKFS